ncbi:hypothetical protein [Aurantiacibacter suaedae]|uniref:hypothetical protein n=1 Tax=Aurantiacibacter suaedae TaxID=2545755 RepID=UPI0010F8A7E7|nr:hypothetical protein [Aurantiacibacter suaedae]
MQGDRIARAKARIEAAAARIEAAAGALAGARQTSGDPELEARYNALRAEAEEALAGLDMLITRLDPDTYDQSTSDDASAAVRNDQ